jgi:hypothetical protein
MRERDSATLQSQLAGLVELADGVASDRMGHGSATPILHEMVLRAGMAEVSEIIGERRSVSVAEIFDALSSPRPSQLRQKLEQHFEPVARPNSPLTQELREADLMVRRGDRAHIAVVSNPQLKRLETVLSEGLVPEGLDTVAFIGSANLNHRSITNYTELQLAILDSVAVTVPINGNLVQLSKFAHEYRCELWQEHLARNRASRLGCARR